MGAAAIGFDLGGTNLRAARVSGDGRVEGRLTEAVTRDAEAVLGRIVDLCRDLDDAEVAAIGIGVPGRVDARRRAVLSGGFLDLAGHRLAERVEQATGKPVLLDNDCNMALVAEMAFGAARGCAHAVMFTIGTGIGGAIALDGRIVRGTATAGQLGHLRVAKHGLPCNCGARGCVETTSSGTALRRHLADAGLPSDLTVEALFALAETGDTRAGRALDRWIVPLRAAIDGMVAAIAPDVVLLGGGLGGAAHRALARAPDPSPWYRCPVRAAALGDDAGVLGAGLSGLRSGGDQKARGVGNLR